MKGKINFSKKRELIKSKSIYIGLALIALGVLLQFENSGIIVGILFIVIIITSYFLSQKIETVSISNPSQK